MIRPRAQHGGTWQPKAPVRSVVGFIGLGDQGHPIAQAIAGDGYPLRVEDGCSQSLDGPQRTEQTVRDSEP